PKTIHEAFHVARTGRPGPVVIDIPKNIMNQLTAYAGKQPVVRASYPDVKPADSKLVAKAVELMATAKRPIFYVGGGVINSGPEACKLLTELVRMTGFPCTNTLMGLGAFPGTDKQFVGMLGMHGSLEANMCMAECDVMINIGARFDDRVTGRLDAFSRKSKKIHVDIDPSSINKNVHAHIPIVGDAGDVIRQMIELWKKKMSTFSPREKGGDSQDEGNAALTPTLSQRERELKEWWEKIEGWRSKKSFKYKQSADGTIKPQYVLDRLNALTKKESTYITTDVGQHQMWAAQFLTFDHPNHWMTSGGLGTMGYGMPSAMGVQIAHPDSLVVCVTGEASILMNIQELSTMMQFKLPLKVLILNNRYMGMVRQWQEMFHGNRHANSYMESLPDFIKLAEAYGMVGLRCDKVADVDATLKKMIETPGPVIVDMMVDQNENVYPMIAAGAAHYELVMGPEDRDDDKLDKSQV
ncbi:MAG: acetolactate synthase 3 large subunit, partial [Alphaproteobacteria bacterium]|nr:acetolactate synthase 3 large subunit [Alphaproteobacteria bacterium]